MENKNLTKPSSLIEKGGRLALCFQILLWALIITLIAFGILLIRDPGNERYEAALELIGIFFGILIISLYYLFEFKSGVMLFLKAIPQEFKSINIIEFMKSYYEKKPYIHLELSKYEITKGGLVTTYDSENVYEYDTYEHRMVRDIKITEKTYYDPDKTNYKSIFRKSENFPFYSYRDVSGTCNIVNASLLDLTIISNTYFADKISILDLNNEENKLKSEYEGVEIFERIYDNTENHYVILRNEKYLNHKWFTFFILIGLAEPYKWYLKSKYKKQTINIKKIISTRNDLFSDENNQLYQSLNPSIILNNTKYKYKMEDIGANKKNSPPQAANESEIAEANKINNLNNYLFQVNNSTKIVDDGFGITGFSNDYKAFK